jgi:hypothetical protein
MVPITSLALPILLSAVFVFVASSIVHMVLGYHKHDFNKVANEDELLEAFRRLNVTPGDYCAPYAGSMEAMKSKEFCDKFAKGPVVTMTVSAGGTMNMGGQLIQWFLYSVIVSFFTAYITSRVLSPGANYLEVFRVAGTVTFMAYAMALPPISIWFKRSWATTFRSMADGLFYALLTGGTFGWLWPRL